MAQPCCQATCWPDCVLFGWMTCLNVRCSFAPARQRLIRSCPGMCAKCQPLVAIAGSHWWSPSMSPELHATLCCQPTAACQLWWTPRLSPHRMSPVSLQATMSQPVATSTFPLLSMILLKLCWYAFCPQCTPHCFKLAVVLLGPGAHFASAAAVACDMRPSTAVLVCFVLNPTMDLLKLQLNLHDEMQLPKQQ